MSHFCKVCLSNSLNNNLTQLKNYVTSDTQNTDIKPLTSRCNSCGLIQKKTDQYYKTKTSELYNDYQIFNQSSINDQKTFGNDGEMSNRAVLIGKRAASLFKKESAGVLAEVGCGYGQFLSEFSHRMPQWKLEGFDLSENYADSVNNINNATYFCDEFTKFHRRYDAIVGIHLLEHLYDPLEFLKYCAKMINPSGFIIFEVPNIKTNLFDLTICDHVCHFSPEHIEILSHQAGLEVVEIDEDYVKRELFIVLKKPRNEYQLKNNNNLEFKGNKNIDFLLQFEKLMEAIESPYYIFGSSIAATWVLQYNRELAIAFLDQDTKRIGMQHQHLPIQSIDQIENCSKVVMPFNIEDTKRIMKTFSEKDVSIIHPDFK